MSVIQGIYIALFGRPADPGGLAYWSEVTKNGQDLAEMLRVLPSLNEYTERFDGQTSDQVITTIYQSLFGRDPDEAGLAFFKGQLDSGALNMASLAVNIAQGAQGDDKADVQAKVDAAILFTESLDTPEEIAAFQGDAANDLAREFLKGVDKDAPATREAVEQAVNGVVNPEEGQAPGGGDGGDGGNGGGGGGGTTGPKDLGLTVGADNLGGTAGEDIFTALTSRSLNSTDALYGGQGRDVLKVALGALGAEAKVAPSLTSIEVLKNSDLGRDVSLGRAIGLQEVWADFSSTNDGAFQRYLDASIETQFGITGNRTNQATVSLKLDPVAITEGVVKLALEGNASNSVSAFSVNSQAHLNKIALNVGAGAQGELSQRNKIDHIEIFGEGSLIYNIESHVFKSIDASQLNGAIAFKFPTIVSNATIKTGAGDDVLNFANATGDLYINAGSGDDAITGGSGNDTINGGDGKDTIKGGIGTNTLISSSGGDKYIATTGEEITFQLGGVAHSHYDGDVTTFDFATATGQVKLNILLSGADFEGAAAAIVLDPTIAFGGFGRESVTLADADVFFSKQVGDAVRATPGAPGAVDDQSLVVYQLVETATATYDIYFDADGDGKLSAADSVIRVVGIGKADISFGSGDVQ